MKIKKITISTFTRHLKNKKGNAYIETLFIMMLIMSLIISFIYLPGPFFKYQDMNHMCRAVVRAVETTGEINDDVLGLIEELDNAYGLDAELTWEGNFIDAGTTRKIQIREKFYLTVATKAQIKLITPLFGPPIVLEIPMHKRVLGIGEVYWKPGEI